MAALMLSVDCHAEVVPNELSLCACQSAAGCVRAPPSQL